MPKHSSSVTHRVTSFNGGKGNDLSHVITAIFVSGVLNHVVAIARVKVHVDIGHADS